MFFTFFGNLIMLYILALVVHEGAHTIMSYVLTKQFLTFHFSWGVLFGVPCIPRFIWAMPDTTPAKQCLIAEVGFVFEILTCGLLALGSMELGAALSGLVALHLFCYPWYSTDGGDFKWFVEARNG